MNHFPSHKPKQIEFIEQRKKSDCGIACAAMLSNRLYGEVAAISQALGINARKGIHLDQMFELLEELSCECLEHYKLPDKGIALVTIQWKEEGLAGHYVVWDSKRKQFLDPLHGVVNKREMLKLAEIDSIWKVVK